MAEDSKVAFSVRESANADETWRTSHEQLRALAARIQAAREQERTHAAREIHDVLAQELTALKMDIAWLGRRLAEPVEAWQLNALREKVAGMMDATDRASQSVRRIATELRPGILDSLGLCAAVEWVAADFEKRSEIRCEVSVPAAGLLMARDCSTALFRIVQESLTNVARHAAATKVEIHLWQEANEIALTVRDNGRGVPPCEMDDPRSVGLLGMRERAAILDGWCVISADAPSGTIVAVRVPLSPVVKKEESI